jgi:Tfp pilus assembly protein PilO
MHLKVLLVPTLVVLILVLAIGFIRPSVADMQAKQIELDTVSAHLADVETAESNIDALNASLDSRSDAEAFVKQYLPERMDQDRPMDALNFLAAQSGVMLTGMELEEVKRVVAIPTDGSVDPAVAAEAEAMADPIPDTYTVSATVRGSYENIKTFLTRASRMDRLHDITAFGIEVDDKEQNQDQEEGVVVDPAANLKGTFEASFAYFSGRPAVAVISAPLFQRSQVDFGPATAALERSTESIPSLDRPESGRSNPFRQ